MVATRSTDFIGNHTMGQSRDLGLSVKLQRCEHVAARYLIPGSTSVVGNLSEPVGKKLSRPVRWIEPASGIIFR